MQKGAASKKKKQKKEQREEEGEEVDYDKWKEEWIRFDELLKQNEIPKCIERILPLWKTIQPDSRVDKPVARKKKDLPDLFCALFSINYTRHANGDFQKSLEAQRMLMGMYLQEGLNQGRSNGLVVGNSAFHLLCAKNLLGMGAAEKEIVEELIRCCAMGGVEMLRSDPQEDRLLQLLKTLPPPAPFASWEESVETTIPNPCWQEYPFSKISKDSFLYSFLLPKWGPRE